MKVFRKFYNQIIGGVCRPLWLEKFKQLVNIKIQKITKLVKITPQALQIRDKF